MDTPIATAELVVAAPPAAEDELSIADHERAFSRATSGAPQTASPSASDDEESEPRGADGRDAAGRFARHRAESQRATPEDVEQINALTKELRDLEGKLKTSKPDALTGSNRLRSLQQRIRGVKADLAELEKPASIPTATGDTKATVEPRVERPAGAGELVEPKLEDFANEPDQYAAWMRAVAKYDRQVEQREAERRQQASSQQAKQQQMVRRHVERAAQFAAKTPDFETTVTPFRQRPLPTLLTLALISDDNGPAYEYHLATHPDVLDELFLLTDGKSVTDASVAIVQRRLKQHVQAAVTGSAAVAAPPIPPKPPNPVRTGQIRTGDELPGDDASLAEHERVFGPKRRRR